MPSAPEATSHVVIRSEDKSRVTLLHRFMISILNVNSGNQNNAPIGAQADR